MRVAAVVLAAGDGVRLGARVPKAFVEVAGKSLLRRSLETLAGVPLLDRLVPVVPASQLGGPSLARLGEGLGDRMGEPVPGGVRRQDSVRTGLEALPREIEWVAIHDAARCLVSRDEVERVVRTAIASDGGAAILARPSPDTLKLVRNGLVVSTPERGSCWAAQTPQVFRVDLLREALAKAEADGHTATDDAELVERLGVPVRIVEGSAENLKITHPVDLVIAEALVERERALENEDGEGR